MDLSDLSLLDLNRNKQKIVEEKIARVSCIKPCMREIIVLCIHG